MKGEVEWDEVLNIAVAAYFSNGQSQESAFFLMFGRNVYIPTLANLLHPKLRYLGDKVFPVSRQRPPQNLKLEI